MKCKCGAWASVKETREDRYGRTRRRYECASLHRFTTYEISDTLMRTLSKDRLEASVRVREIQGAYLVRDAKIIKAVEIEKRTSAEVAREHGISRSRVYLILKRHRASKRTPSITG